MSGAGMMKKLIVVFFATCVVFSTTVAHAILPTWSDGQTVTAANLNAYNDSLKSAIADSLANTPRFSTKQTVSDSLALAVLKVAVRDSANAAISANTTLLPKASVRDSANAAIAAETTHLLKTAVKDSVAAELLIKKPATFTTLSSDSSSYIALGDSRGLADSTFSGFTTILQAGAALKFGDICYQNRVSKKLYAAQGDSLISVEGLYLCVTRSGIAAATYGTFLVEGVCKFTPWTGVTTDSSYVYVSPTSAGAPTTVRPGTTGQWAARAGRALATDILLFKPADTEILIP